MAIRTSHGERGATLPEFALLLSIVSFCSITVLSQTGEAALYAFNRLGTAFDTPGGTISTEPGGRPEESAPALTARELK